MPGHRALLQEGTLAGPFTPVVLAVIAAVTTGAVVAGVVTGPTVMNCIERGDFNQCISEAYFGAEPLAIAAVPEPEPEAEAVAEPEAAPEPEVAEPEAQESVAAAVEVVAPAFTLVRVEPDGSAVIAGSASPASEIQIFANGDLLGSETTEPGGDFAYVTGDPLPSGGVELRLLDVASGEFATTSIVVIVQDDRTSEALVVASEPGAASEILQGLETEAPAPAEVAEAPAEPTAPVEEILEVAEVSEPLAVVAPPAPVQAEAPAAEPAEEEAAITEPVEDESAATEPVEEAVTIAEPVEPEAPAVEIVIVPPTIDAVEIDGDRNFFAGGGTEGLAVRLYVENRAVGTTEVADGRWLVEAINVLTAQSQRIRADMIDADGVVVGRAEVDFVIDLPEQEVAEEPVVVAEAPPPEPAVEPVLQPAPDPAPEAAPMPAAEPEPAIEPEAAPEPAPAEEPVAETVPTLVGVSDGERTTSGQVIIRRGDNLWTIARRVYGEGLRYTQIFEANAGQIRNPDLIYPGQVFDLPGTDMVIGEEE